MCINFCCQQQATCMSKYALYFKQKMIRLSNHITATKNIVLTETQSSSLEQV